METLSSFWQKLTLGTYVKVSYTDHSRSKGGVSVGKIVLVQSNAVARDGNNYDNTKQFTKEKPCYFRKPKASEVEIIRIANGWVKKNNAQQNISKNDELILKVKAGHFKHFQDLFTEVTSPYSDFYGIDPYPIWEVANGIQ